MKLKHFFYKRDKLHHVRKYLGGLIKIKTKKSDEKIKTGFYFLDHKLFSLTKKNKIGIVSKKVDGLSQNGETISQQIGTLSQQIDTIKFENANFFLQTLEQINILKYIHLQAQNTHKKIFEKYKDIYKGKDVVIVASGPSLNEFEFIEDAIYVGVNNTYKNEKTPLDYIFAQDSFPIVEDADSNVVHYRAEKCKKFFGCHYMQLSNFSNLIISEKDVDDANAERYYFLSHSLPSSNYAILSADITTRPLNTWGSVVFPALEFALWTHPRKIYLVGCDCALNGYFKEQHSPINTKQAGYDNMYQGWLEMKKFIRGHYPDVEIISVNPVGLKGMFKDYYQKGE